ncbi:MAG: hypothetical protein IT308_12040 [Anaerolineaceae bacterium]|nr:hypothetical protein [Anaerolineaceae bacterium]
MKILSQNKLFLWLSISAFFAVAIYLLAARLTAGMGFPLDDAWIHQTYARNLGRLGEWSFIPGTISGGSTSPAWSVLLSTGYLFSKQAFGWAYWWGWLCLALSGVLGEKIFRDYFPESRSRIPLFGIFFVLEWHLVWAAVSGMETILLVASILLFAWMLLKPQKNWGALGGLTGLAVWIRPDALTLLGPAIFCAVLIPSPMKGRLAKVFKILGMFLAGFLPYLVFNALVSGSMWPNTFFAKQAEYQVLLEAPLIWRFLKLASLPLVGSGVLLLPGAIYFIGVSWRKKAWAGLSLVIWQVGYTLIYALRLPVSYQHGRYLMPAMTVYFVISLLGYYALMKRLKSAPKWKFILKTSWSLTIWLVLVAFYGLGAGTFVKDVGIIQTEMVKTALWVNGNTAENALIAAHDIGALGYFGNRELVDLAGLISPEVIPFIRDEERLGEYMDTKKVDYLITFPEWYPALITQGQKVYSSGGSFAPASGGENMVVYKWR